MPYIRSNLNISRIPGKDGDAVEPVDISSYFNISKVLKIFNIDLSSLKTGEVQNQGKIFNLVNPEGTSGKCAIAVGSTGTGENLQPPILEGISINEDVSSLIFLHASALPSDNLKAYFNIPDFFDSADLLGWYEIVYEDGFKDIVPIQYGVNILEWNPGGKNKVDIKEDDAGAAQNMYCYQADPVNCSSNSNENPITFFAYEWVNKRFGKRIKEVNIHGTVNYQALTKDYGTPVTKPMKSNAILLAGITKVKKRMPFLPN